MSTQTNPFERLVTTACEQRWCWHLYCTTCGNMEIRRGLDLIGTGLLPGQITRERVMATEIPKELMGASECDERLARQCAEASLATLSTLRSPNWLGCLGLVLYRFGPPNFNLLQVACWERISVSWSQQFLSLIHPGIDSHVPELLRRCRDGETKLRWEHLTPIERCLPSVRTSTFNITT